VYCVEATIAMPDTPTPASRWKQLLIDVAVQHGESGQGRAERLKPMLQSLAHSAVRVVVVGEVKKGKSSFLNALLDDPTLLPTAIDVATSTVNLIAYGPAERITVYFRPVDADAEPAPPQPIRRDQMAAYGTEDGNPGNAKNVDFLAIELPHPLLKEGLVFVDTPGIGGLVRQHRDITIRYAPQTDAVIFVLDSVEAVIGDVEIQFLNELKQQGRPIAFLQTKVDLAGTEQVQAWKARNLEVLSQALKVEPARIPYFLVGSKLKQFADENRDDEALRESGYLAVRDYLTKTILASRDAILTRRWLPVLAAELLASSKLASDRLAIARNAHQPQLAQYESQLAEAEKAFDHWQNVDWPEQYRSFQDATGRLKRQLRNRLQDELSSEDPACAESLEALRSQCQTAADVSARGEVFLADWAERWNKHIATLLDEYQAGFHTQVVTLTGKMAEGLQKAALPEFRVTPVERRGEFHDPVAALRDAAISSNTFGSLASEAGHMLGTGASMAYGLGLLAHPIGWAVTAVASVGYLATRIWMAVRSYRVANERQRDAAIASLERALARTAAVAQRGGLRLFDELVAELDSMAHAKVDAFRAQTKQEFSDRRQAILQARSRDKADATEAEGVVRTELAGCQTALGRLQELKREMQNESV
jgi:GTP-binding protein EngB required for normal cell division